MRRRRRNNWCLGCGGGSGTEESEAGEKRFEIAADDRSHCRGTPFDIQLCVSLPTHVHAEYLMSSTL